MTLEQLCESLSEQKQLKLAIDLINISLPAWEEYTKSNTLTYRDTVVGLTHTVDKDLLHDTINEIASFLAKPEAVILHKG